MKWPRPIMCGLVFLLVNAAVFSAGAGTGAADFDNVPPALIVELLYRNNDLATPDRPMYRSPGALAVSPDKKHLYVAEETAKRVAVVSTSSNAVEREILLPNQPTGLAVSVDGSRLFVTCASEIWPSGYLHEVSIASGGIARSFAAGHFARSPVLSKDESQVFVCNQFDNTVGVVDLNAGRQTAAIPMVREPFHASLTPDGKTLVVANSLPLAKANDSDTTNVSSFVSLIDTDTRSLEASIRLPAGSHSVFGTTVTPDGRYAFVSYLFANYFLVADQLTAGWVHTNNCAIVDLSSQRLLDVLTLDQAGGGAANPWGVGVTDDGKYLCTVHSGSNELHRLDVEKAVELASTRDTYRHLALLGESIRTRISLWGKGQRDIVLVGDTAYLSVYFSDSLAVVDLEFLTTGRQVGGISLNGPAARTAVRRGECHFYDGSLCIQDWQSCHSCHPMARPDGLNWILAKRNNATKNAKSMLYSYYTPPTAWAGRRENSAKSIEAGIAIELQLAADPSTVGSIDAYFKSLRPMPSPFLIKGKLSSAARKGREIYHSDKVDCIRCHEPPLYYQESPTPAFVPDPDDNTPSWDVPSIIEAWRTAPYGHLGSYLDMEEFLMLPGHSGNMKNLTQEERDALVQYVLSL